MGGVQFVWCMCTPSFTSVPGMKSPVSLKLDFSHLHCFERIQLSRTPRLLRDFLHSPFCITDLLYTASLTHSLIFSESANEYNKSVITNLLYGDSVPGAPDLFRYTAAFFLMLYFCVH